MECLHFAPESFFRDRFRKEFKSYTTVDLYMEEVDVKADLRKLPFPDKSFDLVFASHVLEHIKDDLIALSEVRRVLRRNGIAILPVPIVGQKTVEYPEPNPLESDHVRAPGLDYYDRYRDFFSEVSVFSSTDFDPKFQVFIYENRSRWPTKEMPLRQPSSGVKHADFVPVCYV